MHVQAQEDELRAQLMQQKEQETRRQLLASAAASRAQTSKVPCHLILFLSSLVDDHYDTLIMIDIYFILVFVLRSQYYSICLV